MVNRRSLCFSLSGMLWLASLLFTVGTFAQGNETTTAPPVVTPVTITVEPGARQSFAGFGASLGNWGDAKWNREQGGFTPGQTFAVTVKVPELKERGKIAFTVHRSDATRKNAGDGNASMHDGEITLRIAPLELVTLRSAIP